MWKGRAGTAAGVVPEPGTRTVFGSQNWGYEEAKLERSSMEVSNGEGGLSLRGQYKRHSTMRWPRLFWRRGARRRKRMATYRPSTVSATATSATASCIGVGGYRKSDRTNPMPNLGSLWPN